MALPFQVQLLKCCFSKGWINQGQLCPFISKVSHIRLFWTYTPGPAWPCMANRSTFCHRTQNQLWFLWPQGWSWSQTQLPVYAGKPPGYEVIHQVPAAIHMCSVGWHSTLMTGLQQSHEMYWEWYGSPQAKHPHHAHYWEHCAEVSHKNPTPSTLISPNRSLTPTGLTPSPAIVPCNPNGTTTTLALPVRVTLWWSYSRLEVLELKGIWTHKYTDTVVILSL